MAKYSILAIIDLNVEVLDSTPIDEVELVTRKKLEILVDKKRGVEIKNLRTHFLGTPEKFGEENGG
jgi:hypothetical protein